MNLLKTTKNSAQGPGNAAPDEDSLLRTGTKKRDLRKNPVSIATHRQKRPDPGKLRRQECYSENFANWFRVILSDLKVLILLSDA